YYKPDVGYSYDTASGLFYQGTLLTDPLYFPTNTYQIFSYADPAWSYALGAQVNVGGAFLTLTNYNQVSLPSVWPPDPTQKNYIEHFWHSAEFEDDYPPMWLFWDEVLYQMGIKKNL
ncbi:MAG: hypothetical protein ACREC8_07095, partial [Limisphaerales bacterium]